MMHQFRALALTVDKIAATLQFSRSLIHGAGAAAPADSVKRTRLRQRPRIIGPRSQYFPESSQSP